MKKKILIWILFLVFLLVSFLVLIKIARPRIADYRKYSFYSKLAKTGHLEYQRMLAVYFYDKGEYDKSLEWQLRSAEGGDPIAQTFMGHYFRYGINDQMKPHNLDYTKALQWYQKAANQNYSPAQIEIGDMYFLGLGVTQNYEKAYCWSCLSLTKIGFGGIWERANQNKKKAASILGIEAVSRIDKEIREWQKKQKNG